MSPHWGGSSPLRATENEVIRMLSHKESTLDFKALTPSPLTPIPGAAPGDGFEP